MTHEQSERLIAQVMRMADLWEAFHAHDVSKSASGREDMQALMKSVKDSSAESMEMMKRLSAHVEAQWRAYHERLDRLERRQEEWQMPQGRVGVQ